MDSYPTRRSCAAAIVVWPQGQRGTPEGEVVFGPTVRLDIEAELGLVVGTGSTLGESACTGPPHRCSPT